MKKNENNTDRIVRGVVAVAAAIGAVLTSGALSIVLWVVAAIMAVT
ncbi:YgaP-like transmembrane domain, partial [Corynebacterium argentoratense]